MKDDRVGLENVKADIQRKTKKEKLERIDMYIDMYRKNRENLGNQLSHVYKPDFIEDILKLKEDIQNDNSEAYNRDWNWFYNVDNIPNHEAVLATKDFIENIRSDEFDSLYFFNLLFRQMDDLKDSLENPISYFEQLQQLKLNKTQRHILYGMLLYWYGGYPVNNLNPKYNVVLKLIEKEFLRLFPDVVTPEMKFCKGDQEFKTSLSELGNKISSEIQVLVLGGNVHNVHFDFGELPLYIQNEVRSLFDQKEISGTVNYVKWTESLRTFLGTIPKEFQFLALQKGIDYGKMRYEFFLKNECEDQKVSPYVQSWERRFKLAEDLLVEFDTPNEANNDFTIESPFELNSSIISKIDLIRLLNVLTEMRGFKNTDGTIPSKKAVMIAFGRMFGIDMATFGQDLNKAFEKSEEANLKFFQALNNKALELWKQKNY